MRQRSETYQELGVASRKTPHLRTRDEVAAYIAGTLLGTGFHRFQNGGLPQFERRFGDWVQEILLYTGSVRTENGVAVQIRLHTSHSAVKAVRERFWHPASSAPPLVAAGDLGQLDLPPMFDTWWVSDQVASYDELGRAIQGLAIPWFDLFEDEDELVDQLLGPGIALIDHATALETLVALNRRRAARHYVQQFLLQDAEFVQSLKGLPDLQASRRVTAPYRAAMTAVLYRLR